MKCIVENQEQALTSLKEADEIAARINMTGNARRTEIRQALSEEFVKMLRAEGQLEEAKRLKNTSPERLLWEVLRPSKLKEIQDLIAGVMTAT